MSQRFIPKLQVHRDIAVWSGGNPQATLDVWLLHAFADSHQCFQYAFESALAKRVRIHLFDLPGHGASPPRPDGLIVEEVVEIWAELISTISGIHSVILAGHSMAGIIATLTAQAIDKPPKLMINLEGNLTPADAFLTGQAAHYQSPDEFFNTFRATIVQMAANDQISQQYLCSLQFADPLTLWTLGRSVVEQPDIASAFLNLSCPKVYYFDPSSLSQDTQAFLAHHDIPQRRFTGVGHWSMVKSPDVFYAALDQDIQQMVEHLAVGEEL